MILAWEKKSLELLQHDKLGDFNKMIIEIVETKEVLTSKLHNNNKLPYQRVTVKMRNHKIALMWKNSKTCYQRKNWRYKGPS